MTKMKVVAGAPGVGKSTRLIEDGVQAILLGNAVYITTPTNTARNNLIEKIDELLKEEGHKHFDKNDRAEALKSLRGNIHLIGADYQAEDFILIDEISMISVGVFKSLLFDANPLPDVQIVAYGDAKQLPAIHANSVIEMLLRENISTDLWEWVKEAYEDAPSVMVPPANWRLEGDVEFETMLINYRLNELGFDGYDAEYIDTLFANAIDYSDDDTKDYSAEIIAAVENYSLIMTSTHERGEEVNAYIKQSYGTNASGIMPFVKSSSDTKVYLNPENKDQESLHKAFPFIKDVDSTVNQNGLEPTAYVVVDIAQGATVDNAVYYFGDTKIPNGVQNFYSYNRLYTAITRSRNLTKLIGDMSEVRKQLNLFPMSAQQRLEYRFAQRTMKELFNRMYVMTQEITEDEAYSLFMKLFNEGVPDGKVQQELIDYNVTSKPYTLKQMVLRFKDYDVTQGQLKSGSFVVDYKVKFYDENISRANSEKMIGKANAKGRGKVQNWINSLSQEELNQVKRDVQVLSVRKFADKYNKMAKKNVISALGL